MRAARVSPDVMIPRLVLALALGLSPWPALAAPTPGPASAPAGEVHNGGTIDGRLTTVDYQRSVIGVDAGARGRIDVTVMPSTSIQGNDSAYRSFSDLKPGQRVEIFSSIAGGKFVAQIIRIL
jgi:hypothetical protein